MNDFDTAAMVTVRNIHNALGEGTAAVRRCCALISIRGEGTEFDGKPRSAHVHSVEDSLVLDTVREDVREDLATMLGCTHPSTAPIRLQTSATERAGSMDPSCFDR